jgi:hypothetical protein
MADLAADARGAAENLAYLQGDLTDDALRGHLVENARRTRREIEALLASAVSSGELRRDIDARTLARTVDTVINGSLFTWAMCRGEKAVGWIGRDLDAVLAPWLPTAGRGAQRRYSRGLAPDEGSEDERSRAPPSTRRRRRFSASGSTVRVCSAGRE